MKKIFSFALIFVMISALFIYLPLYVSATPVLDVFTPIIFYDEISHSGFYIRPDAAPILIHNSGDSTANISSVTVSDTEAFEIGGSGSTVEAGDYIITWTVQPKAGLKAGTYTAAVTVTYDGGATAEAEVSFTVKLPAPVYWDGIEIVPPYKTVYTEGEILDLTGLEVYSTSGIIYGDGTSVSTGKSKISDTGYSVDLAGKPLTVDDKYFVVSVGGGFPMSRKFEITVNPKLEILSVTQNIDTYDEVKVELNRCYEDAAALIVAVYGGGKLLCVKSEALTSDYTIFVNINIPENADTIKAMIWKDLFAICPLCDAFSVSHIK